MRAAGDAIAYAAEQDLVNGEASLSSILDRVFADIDAQGLGVLAQPGRARHDYAAPRRQDVGAVLNRLRSFQVRGRGHDAANETGAEAAPGSGQDSVPPLTEV
jgi:hypothetical protein